MFLFYLECVVAVVFQHLQVDQRRVGGLNLLLERSVSQQVVFNVDAYVAFHNGGLGYLQLVADELAHCYVSGRIEQCLQCPAIFLLMPVCAALSVKHIIQFLQTQHRIGIPVAIQLKDFPCSQPKTVLLFLIKESLVIQDKVEHHRQHVVSVVAAAACSLDERFVVLTVLTGQSRHVFQYAAEVRPAQVFVFLLCLLVEGIYVAVEHVVVCRCQHTAQYGFVCSTLLAAQFLLSRLEQGQFVLKSLYIYCKTVGVDVAPVFDGFNLLFQFLGIRTSHRVVTGTYKYCKQCNFLPHGFPLFEFMKSICVREGTANSTSIVDFNC